MNTPNTFMTRLLVSGRRACFRRPECSTDLITYDAMPPTVGRRIVGAVLGTGGWSLDRIIVARPIQFDWTEVETVRGLKRALTLVNVSYVLEVSCSTTNMAGVIDVERPIHLGLVDYPAAVRHLADHEPPEAGMIGTGKIDLGWMIYDTVASKPRFFRGEMIDGVIDVSQRADRILIC